MSISATPMSTSELICLSERSPTTDLPTASRAFGFGTNLGYALYAKGEFPCRVLKVGRKLRVPVADLLVALGIDPSRRDVTAP